MLSVSVTACCSGDDGDLLGSGTSGATSGTTWTVVRVSGLDEHWERDFNNYSATFNSDGTTVITPSSRWGNPQWSQNGNLLKLTYPDKVLIMDLTYTGAATATADSYWEGNKDNAASHATFVLQKQ